MTGVVEDDYEIICLASPLDGWFGFGKRHHQNKDDILASPILMITKVFIEMSEKSHSLQTVALPHIASKPNLTTQKLTSTRTHYPNDDIAKKVDPDRRPSPCQRTSLIVKC
jgi:hypothetical protein